MGTLLLAQTSEETTVSFGELVRLPVFWAIVLGALAILSLVPRSGDLARAAGTVLGTIALGLLIAAMPLAGSWLGMLVFWLLAILTVFAAAATICMRSPVYAAIWFALSLVGVSGLLLYQGAQFLGVATIAVYAGAIVVTFLFVVMLAQPEGHSTYDRISWGWFPKVFSVVSAAAFLLLLTTVISQPSDPPRQRIAKAIDKLAASDSAITVSGNQLAAVEQAAGLRVLLTSDASAEQAARLQRRLPDALGVSDAQVSVSILANRADLLHPNHMAHMGSQLFSRHLLSVELAGTLLLVALVGAVAIVIQGRQSGAAGT